MFQTRRRHRFNRFDRFADYGPFAAPVGARRAWRHAGFRPRRRRSPALAILLAGLAVVAFGKLMSALNRPNRSTAEKIGLGALLAVVGAMLLSLRSRGARRYRW